MKIPIDQITASLNVQVRLHLDDETVQRYMECYDALPPVDVFEVDGTYLLADGFHRREAARRLGLGELDVTVQPGGRDEAIAFAITANIAHGKPLTRTERNIAVQRLLDLGWTQQRISDELGIARATIVNIDNARDLRESLPPRVAMGLTDTHLYRIAGVDKADQKALATRAVKSHWTEPETRAAAKTFRDPNAAPQVKAAILDGSLPPISTVAGQVVIQEDTITRMTEEALGKDAQLALVSFLQAARQLSGFTPDQVAEAHGAKLWPATVAQLEAIAKMIPALIARLTMKRVTP